MWLHKLSIPGEKGLKDLRIGGGKITAYLPSSPENNSLARTSPETNPENGPPAENGQKNLSASENGPAYLPPAGNGLQNHSILQNHLSAEPSLAFDGCLAFPGLINSHDHLDFNLFPSLGNGIYQNYQAWGPDIHTHNKAKIDAVLKIPQPLRILWGLYKNLLNGFTTVVNHGEKLPTDENLITVFQDYHCLHSVGFEKRWRTKLNKPGIKDWPFVLHVGEGTDPAATQEIDRLIRWNLFKRPLIGVHGVAMTEKQAAAFKALVWCPASNYFLLDSTAPVDRLKNKVPLLFGTDSTLTADWNSWDQIRIARQDNKVTDRELLDMLTIQPAATWGLTGCGTLAAGSQADLIIARPGKGAEGKGTVAKETMSMNAFYALNPDDFLLILHKGNIRLFDESLLDQLSASGLPVKTFYKIPVGGRIKYISGDLPGLMKEIHRYYPELEFPAMVAPAIAAVENHTIG